MTMASKKSDKTEPEDLGYTEAANELEAILEEIEKGDADVDVLSTRVERAALLIRHCREKLAGTELAVKRVVEQLASEKGEED
jgi:exodeoxyribonuclease VII small subunit